MDKLPLEIEHIILDYLAQLEYCKRFDKLMREFKTSVKYVIKHKNFSQLYVKNEKYNFYLGSDNNLLVVKNKIYDDMFDNSLVIHILT